MNTIQYSKLILGSFLQTNHCHKFKYLDQSPSFFSQDYQIDYKKYFRIKECYQKYTYTTYFVREFVVKQSSKIIYALIKNNFRKEN